MNKPQEELALLRHQIDEIDAAIITQIAARFAVTNTVGQLKARATLPAQDPARERAQMQRYHDLAREVNMHPSLIQTIFTHIIEQVVRDHQKITSAHDTSSTL